MQDWCLSNPEADWKLRRLGQHDPMDFSSEEEEGVRGWKVLVTGSGAQMCSLQMRVKAV